MSGPPISGPVADEWVRLVTEVAHFLLDAGIPWESAGFLAYDSVRAVLAGPERTLLSWEEYDD